MRIYNTMKPLKLYTQMDCSLPKGEKPGFGNLVFLLSPSRESAYDILKGNFLEYKKCMYKYCMIDFIYREKIGYKKYMKNNTGVFKKEFTDISSQFSSPLRLITNSNRVNILKKTENILVNFGEWNQIYFEFQVKKELGKICENYLTFLGNKIQDPEFNAYEKILYVNLDQWFTENRKFGLDRKSLHNPISILLVALYKFPSLIEKLGNRFAFLIVSEALGSVLKLDKETLTKQNYGKIKSRILSMINRMCIDATATNENVIDETPLPNNVDDMTDAQVIQKINQMDEVDQDKKRRIILTRLKRNLLGGEVDDITEELTDDGIEVEFEEGEEDEEFETDNEEVNEVENLANTYMDDHPEILEGEDLEVALQQVEKAVKKRHYINEFTPKYSDAQLKKLAKLDATQTKLIGNIEQSFQDLERKKIDTSDYSNVVTTSNMNIIQSKFANFDRSYNEKKLSQDIDNCVAHMSTAMSKVYITDIKEEDTSTQLDLKKTLTYTLEDELGNTMHLKFDVPIIFDDHFMYIKGNKKVIQHQLILKPIVKTNRKQVQIVSNYNKVTLERQKSRDFKANALLRYLRNNAGDLHAVKGNGVAINRKFKTTLEYNLIAKEFVEFKIDSYIFILDIPKLMERLDKLNIPYTKIDLDKNVIVGIDMKNKKPIVMRLNDSFVDCIIDCFPGDIQENIKRLSYSLNGGRSLSCTNVKILSKWCPLIVLLLFWEGFESVMIKSGIEYELISKDDAKDVDLYEWGLTPMADGYIKWKRYPMENSLLMNGLNSMDTELYTLEELESKDTYIYMMTHIHEFANQAFNLDQFKDFMIDPITKEILIDLGYPTDIVSLCLYANKLLVSDDAAPDSDMRNMRLRGNEIIAFHVYQAIASAYGAYRKSVHRKKVTKISMKQDEVLSRLLKGGVTNDYSALNPVCEVSELRAVSYKGESGINKDYAMTLPIRRYNESMLGVVGITTSPDGNVGINRQLTWEPNITSTRGYIDVVGQNRVEEMNSANLLTPAEMLTPLGVQHDDPARTSMGYKQTIAMVMVQDSDPALIGNGTEKTLPYHLSSDFSIVAEEDGIVVDKSDNCVVIKYKSGKFRTIDTSIQVKKNSSSGFYIESKLSCDKNVGDKVTKNEVIAWDNKAYAKNKDGKDASMRLGPLLKVAIIPEWDIYEDSAPLTKNASERMTTTMVMPINVTLNKDATVSEMLKIGDTVNAGDAVIKFDNFAEDEFVVEWLKSMREDLQEDIIESNQTTKKSHYTGTIVDIKIYTTVELDELSDSLKKIVGEYWKRLRKKEKLLDKYKNPEDVNFYKSGNLITEATTPVKPDYDGRIKGEKVDEGVLIIFYISFDDVMSRGDKLASEFALKSINSHVIEEGLEPYSEFRPDESIDLITAPLSISARKTPSIFLAMFGNKCLIEAKRHLKEYWENN